MRPLSVDIYCRELPEGGASSAPVPDAITMSIEERAPRFGDALEDALSQSWQFPEGRDVLRACRFVISLRENTVRPVTAGDRLRDLQRGVEAVLEIVHADAIHCVDSQQVIPPGLFLGEVEARGFPTVQAGAINVRLYRVDAPGVAEGRLVMDTLGLHAFGLPDLQIDFRWLEPGAVARTLFAAAGYIFEQGDVIEDGHTIEGCLPGSRWTASHGQSLVEPHREVLILDPGQPYSTRDE
jgi:hypothetical protein